jgi:hypothetical protein
MAELGAGAPIEVSPTVRVLLLLFPLLPRNATPVLGCDATPAHPCQQNAVSATELTDPCSVR